LECCLEKPCHCGDCEEGSCVDWECCEDNDCPDEACGDDDHVAGCDEVGHTCICALPGVPIVRRLIIKTETCEGCDQSDEGVVLKLEGEENQLGMPNCTTALLDHSGQQDFGEGGEVEFGGAMDEGICAGCYKYPLGGWISKGSITWKGQGNWKGETICVKWTPAHIMDVLCEINSDGTLATCSKVANCVPNTFYQKQWLNGFF